MQQMQRQQQGMQLLCRRSVSARGWVLNVIRTHTHTEVRVYTNPFLGERSHYVPDFPSLLPVDAFCRRGFGGEQCSDRSYLNLPLSFLPASAARRLLCRPASVAGCRKVARLTGCRVIRLDARVRERERGAEGGRGGRSERREIKGRHDADASLFTRERSLSLSYESRARERESAFPGESREIF